MGQIKYILIFGMALCFFFCFMASAQKKKIPGADSLANRTYITKIHISDPDKALALLDHAEQYESMPLCDIYMMRSMTYNEQRQYNLSYLYAMKAFELDTVQKTPKLFLHVSGQLTSYLIVLGRYQEAIEKAILTKEKAHEIQDAREEASAIFTIGKLERLLNRTERSYQLQEKAISMLERSSNVRDLAMLSFFYGEMTRCLIEDEQKKRALDICVKREQVIKTMNSMQGPPALYIDKQYAYLYSKMAKICVDLGREREADNYYLKFMDTHYGKSKVGRWDAIPYLLEKGAYRQILENLESDKEDYLGLMRGDTFNTDYKIFLSYLVDANKGLGNYRQALHYQERINVISDTINARERENVLAEFFVIYQTQEKEALILSQAVELEKRERWVIAFACIIVSLGLILWLMFRSQRIIQRKNRFMVNQINFSMEQEEELRSLKKQLVKLSSSAVSSSGDLVTETVAKELVVPQKERETKDQSELLAHVFERISQLVEGEQVYLDNQLTRDTILKRLHIDRNIFAQAIQEHTNSNFSEYVNRLRLEYSLKLMRVHPNYTIESIALESGFGNVRTYHRVFKDKIKMTPAEYKRAIESND